MSVLYDSLLGFVSRPLWAVAVDAADILLVAYLFYRVLLLLKGTRAMQMVVGLVFVVLVYQLSRSVGLITLFSILDRLLSYAVLIVVVLFQNDIRRALMRVGSRPFFRGARGAREAHVVEEVVRAAHSLAERRIGALIVFERAAELDEFIEHGTRLDAEVTRELLYSIFLSSRENPLHDGAVVVRDGRLFEAGVFLPLTDSSRLDRSFGTRHRAAVGITEETDAVVIVVSEERGSIGLCFDGNIIGGLDMASLRHALHGLFAKPPKPKARPSTAGRESLVEPATRPSRVSVAPPPPRPSAATPPVVAAAEVATSSGESSALGVEETGS